MTPTNIKIQKDQNTKKCMEKMRAFACTIFFSYGLDILYMWFMQIYFG